VKLAAEFVIAILLPTAAGWALIASVRASTWFAERRRVAPEEPLGRLQDNLRRLRAELEAVETTQGVPAKALRLRALRAAYLDTLGNACQKVGVSPPRDGERAPLAEIYRVESALREHGVDVRRLPSVGGHRARRLRRDG
jgi:hypothetical protein